MTKHMRHIKYGRRSMEPYYCPRCSAPYQHFDELQDHALDVHKVELKSAF